MLISLLKEFPYQWKYMEGVPVTAVALRYRAKRRSESSVPAAGSEPTQRTSSGLQRSGRDYRNLRHAEFGWSRDPRQTYSGSPGRPQHHLRDVSLLVTLLAE